MIDPGFVRMMAAYNAWQNQQMLAAVDQLEPVDRSADQGAFFGSIEKTLNHLLWADQIWTHRLAGMDKPSASSIPDSTSLHDDYADYRNARREIDKSIIAWANGCSGSDFDGNLTWFSRSTGRDMSSPKARAIVHMFNHQTHHRGQIHVMLTRIGVKTHTTDLVFMPEAQWPD